MSHLSLNALPRLSLSFALLSYLFPVFLKYVARNAACINLRGLSACKVLNEFRGFLDVFRSSRALERAPRNPRRRGGTSRLASGGGRTRGIEYILFPEMNEREDRVGKRLTDECSSRSR